MAEPFSIAVAALELSANGVKLMRSLRDYLDSVRTVDQHIGKVADQVQLTSTTLENVATVFNDPSFHSLYKQELLDGTEQALAGCRRAFRDLEKFVIKSLKRDDDGKAIVSISTRFTFYFKEKELDVLQARLERFINSLGVIVGVLNLALSMKTVKDTNVIERQKKEISSLQSIMYEAQRKELSTKQQIEDLLTQMRRCTPCKRCVEKRDFCAMKKPPCAQCQRRGLADQCEWPATQVDAEIVDITSSSSNVKVSPSLFINEFRTLGHGMVASTTPEQPRFRTNSEPEMSTPLQDWIAAAIALSNNIQSADGYWRTPSGYHRKCLGQALAGTKQVIEALSALQKKDHDGDDPSLTALESYLPSRRNSITMKASTPKSTTLAQERARKGGRQKDVHVSSTQSDRKEDEDTVTSARHFQASYAELFIDDMEPGSTPGQVLDVDELLHRWTTLGA